MCGGPTSFEFCLDDFDDRVLRRFVLQLVSSCTRPVIIFVFLVDLFFLLVDVDGFFTAEALGTLNLSFLINLGLSNRYSPMADNQVKILSDCVRFESWVMTWANLGPISLSRLLWVFDRRQPGPLITIFCARHHGALRVTPRRCSGSYRHSARSATFCTFCQHTDCLFCECILVCCSLIV